MEQALSEKMILIVGGGFGQLPAIIAARQLGFKVIVVDRNPDALGMPLADIALSIDIVDIDAVVAVAQQYQVCGALTMQSDIGVPTVGAVVDALGLPGAGKTVAQRCSNKILTRKAFQRASVPQPNFVVISNLQEAEQAAINLGYPCVLKAPDSSGSRGVTKLRSQQDIPAAFKEAMRYTRGTELLLEEFISGLEIGAQSFSVAGRCELVLIHDDELSTPPFMVPIAHAFPSSLSDIQLEKATVAVSKCVEALGITDGPSNIDLILDINGDVQVIEVGARIGATCLPELVFHHTGIDWVKATVQIATGEKPNLRKKRLRQPCAAFILESPDDGIMQGYTFPYEYEGHPDLLEWEITAKPGDLVSRLRKGTDRIGKVVTRGKSTEAAIDLGRKIRNAICIDISHEGEKG